MDRVRGRGEEMAPGPRKGHLVSLGVLVGVLTLALGSVTAVSLYLNRLTSTLSAVATGEPMSDYEGRPTKGGGQDGARSLDLLVWVVDDEAGLLSANLVHLSAARDQLLLVGLPSDLLVGGSSLAVARSRDQQSAVREIELLLQLPVDHLATVELSAFGEVVDALGGLELPAATSTASMVDGDQLGDYLADSPTPTAAVGRVHEVLRATMARLGMSHAVLNPVKFDRVLAAMENCVVVDSSVRVSDIEAILVDSTVRADEVKQITLTTSAGVVDPEVVRQVRQALADDDLSGLSPVLAEPTTAR